MTKKQAWMGTNVVFKMVLPFTNTFAKFVIVFEIVQKVNC